MLGDPHAVADNNGARPHIDGRHALQLFVQQAADAQYIFPCGTTEIVSERLEAVGVLSDEIDIEYRFAAVLERFVMRLQYQLHDALESRNIAADADLAKFAGDPGLPERRHLDRILGCGKALES